MDALLNRLARALPPAMRRQATAERIAALAQFARFGAVGVLGFLVDTATVYALRGQLGLYGAGAAAYGVAATTTWAAHRLWTFREAARAEPVRQWMRFLAANFVGFIVNRGTYAALIAMSELARQQPVIAVAAGSVAGMMLNFHLSRRLVFRL